MAEDLQGLDARIRQLERTRDYHEVSISASATIGDDPAHGLGDYDQIFFPVSMSSSSVVLTLPATVEERYTGVQFLIRAGAISGGRTLTINATPNNIDGASSIILTANGQKVLITPARVGASNWTNIVSTQANIGGGEDGGSGPPFTLVIRSKESDYQATEFDDAIRMKATAGQRVVTLPDISTVSVGHAIRIKKVDSSGNAVVVTAFGTDTIDDAATAELTNQYEAIDVQKVDGDDSNWDIY